MDPKELNKSPNRSINHKKTTYFEKYRRELERISEEMKKDSSIPSNNTLSSPLIK